MQRSRGSSAPTRWGVLAHRSPLRLASDAEDPAIPGARQDTPLTSARDHDGMEHLGQEGRRAEQVLALLGTLDNVCDGGEISELAHALQVASRAERAGADDEVVLAALLHDIGKVFGDAGHAQVSAEVIAPHVRPDVVEVVRHHGAFTARHWNEIGPKDVDPRDEFRDQPWFAMATGFVDDWDMQSFDPGYDAHPLQHFEPLVRRLVTGP